MLNLRLHKTQPFKHMTKSQDDIVVVLRRKNNKKNPKNKTPQIKFSYTLASRLHGSHFSIIYRHLQCDAAEEVLAGGSKLELDRRWGHAEYARGVSAGQERGTSFFAPKAMAG